jgi:hypothetical protein
MTTSPHSESVVSASAGRRPALQKGDMAAGHRPALQHGGPLDQPAQTNTVEVTTKYGEKKRISERKYLAAMQNLARANRALEKQPLSERKRAAIMKNLAKARRAPRTPEGRARSRRNATKHGLYVRHLAGSFLRLGENPRRFAKLRALFERAFRPSDVVEIRLVNRLAEVVWRHLRTYHAAAVRAEQKVHRRLARLLPAVPAALPGPGPAPSDKEVAADERRAYEVVDCLFAEQRLFDYQRLTMNEVERTLRLLLIHRSGDPRFKFHYTGRRYRTEIADLSVDPRNWCRRYAAGARRDRSAV